MKTRKIKSLLIGALAAIALTVAPVTAANAATKVYFNGLGVQNVKYASASAKHYQNHINTSKLPGCRAGSIGYAQIVETKTKGKITGPTQAVKQCANAGTGAGSPLKGTQSKCWWWVGSNGSKGQFSCKTWY